MKIFKKLLKITGLVLLVIILITVVTAFGNLRDKHKGYELDLNIRSAGEAPLKAGFAAVTITPEIPDRWHDNDNNARYEPKKGDTYDDLNGNGKFDAYWIAGFGHKRAANGVHDDLWARTMILDDGRTRLAVVSCDLMGLSHSVVLDIRRMLPSEAGITYLTVSSTHVHEAPDMMGPWGESIFKSGVNKAWREYIKQRVVQSVMEAVDNMRPAILQFTQNLTDGMVTIADTREPYVFDHGLRMMQALDAENGHTLGTLIQWSNHPETLWGNNLLISSDFPHYLREVVEKGVFNGDSLVEPGVGGVAVYINGAIGGLMTTHSSTGVKDPFKDTIYVKPSFDKARAQGDTIGMIILRTMRDQPVMVEKAGISLRAKTFKLPLANKFFRLGAALGVIESGMSGWMKKRTEGAVWRIGPATFLQMPGEMYPEILNGGIDALPGRDYEIAPVESPPLRELMSGEFRFAFGLANDEIGYIIPKSQWDVKAPFVYRDRPYYGEENSMGPETAPIVYRELAKMIEELK